MTLNEVQYMPKAHLTRDRDGAPRNRRRTYLASSVAAGALGLALLAVPWRAQAAPGTATEDTSIRPFRVHMSDEALADLRRRLQAMRWPDKETVPDQTQGAPLARLQALVQYWGSGYDWRKAEAKLNALPQFTTNIDGLDIHFIQVKSKERNALPVLITHGWPGSVFEFLGTIGPLTDPVAHGGLPRTLSSS